MNRQLHWIQSTEFQLVGPYVIILLTEKPFVGVSLALGFWSMRHSAISEDESDFQEHSVGHFWLVYSHGPWPNGLAGAYRTLLCCSVWIL
jgi:hypothetical protein